MMITLAKALKQKNRLAERIRKIDGDIQKYNSRPSKAEQTVDVRKLYSTRQGIVASLVELKTKIMMANAPVWPVILKLAEVKGEIAFWLHVDTRHGQVFAPGYRATEVLDHAADFKKSEVDEKVLELERQADELQDKLDQHNYNTTIEFAMPR